MDCIALLCTAVPCRAVPGPSRTSHIPPRQVLHERGASPPRGIAFAALVYLHKRDRGMQRWRGWTQLPDADPSLLISLLDCHFLRIAQADCPGISVPIAASRRQCPLSPLPCRPWVYRDALSASSHAVIPPLATTARRVNPGWIPVDLYGSCGSLWIPSIPA